MGKTGHHSQKGIGEIDDVPRKNKVTYRLSDNDVTLLNFLSKILGKSKNQIIIDALRVYASQHTSKSAKGSDNTDS